MTNEEITNGLQISQQRANDFNLSQRNSMGLYESAANDIFKKQEACKEAYKAGELAQEQGQDFWQNPHSLPSGRQELFHAWFAGWCHKKLTS